MRVRATAGHRLINFQVSASFDTSLLTSSTNAAAGGVSTYVEGAWSGVEATLNDPVSQRSVEGPMNICREKASSLRRHIARLEGS